MPITPVHVENEFKKNPELTKEAITQIENWLKTQPHLPKIPDRVIAIFLHSRYYDVEKTKYAIETCCTVRTHVPELFSNRDPEHETLLDGYKMVSCFVLPETTPKGERVLYWKYNEHDPSSFHFANSYKYFCAVLELMIREHGTDVGHRIIVDMKELVPEHLTGHCGIIFKKMLFYMQEAMPIRLNGLHFINVVASTNKVLDIMQPFMKDEMRSKIFLHKSDKIDELFKYIPKSILMKDLGGNGPDVKTLNNESISKIKRNRPYFLEEEKERVNEALRPGKPKTAVDLFGPDQ